MTAHGVDKASRFGPQPALRALYAEGAVVHFYDDDGNLLGPIEGAAAWLTRRIGWKINPDALSHYLSGVNVPPAEIKYALAEVLMLAPEDIWTPEVMASTYSAHLSRARRAAR